MKFRISGVILTVLILLVSLFPASANEEALEDVNLKKESIW